MADTINLADHALMAVSRPALHALRAALSRDIGPASASALQEAGYAGGGAVFEAFCAWLHERGDAAPEELDFDAFQRLAAEYFRVAGWGTLEIGSLRDAVAVVDSDDWGEADPSQGLDQPGCHFTTGLLADFFGRLSDVPLAVLEVECRSAGAERCRFLLGNGDVMRFLYDEMENGESYADIVERVE
jgi:predicted hydrocarbon binding protein